MSSEVELMTDEQFETYNKLLQLVDSLVTELLDDTKQEYKNKRRYFLKEVIINQRCKVLFSYQVFSLNLRE